MIIRFNWNKNNRDKKNNRNFLQHFKTSIQKKKKKEERKKRANYIIFLNNVNRKKRAN